MNKAFTLVELAIVLVIIGLITGGVLGAQSLVKSSERQELISDLTALNTAVKAFELEYDSLPGDFDEASDYGINDNFCGTNSGDGNKDKSLQDDGHATQVRLDGEIANFFIHLSNAGIIKEKYTNTTGSSSCGSYAQKPGITFPASTIGTSILALTSLNQNYFVLGMVSGRYNLVSGTTYSEGNLLSPKDAQYIDKKLDDGKHDLGNIMVFFRYYNSNTGNGANNGYLNYGYSESSSNCINSSNYNLANDDLLCQVAIKF